MDDTWRLEAVPVRLSIGEKTLVRPTLPLLVYQGRFDALPAPPSPMPWPSDVDRDAVAGFYVPSRPVTARLPRIALEDGLVRVATHFTRRLVALDGTFDAYQRKWSARSRGNLRRRRRDFARLTGVKDPVVRAYRSEAEVDGYLSAVRAVAERSYQAALLGSVVDEAFASATRGLARDGRLLGSVLFDRDRPVAYTHVATRLRTLLLVRLAYDVEYRSYGPGMILLLHVLEHLFAERAWDVFDFGEGDAEYKTFLSTTGLDCAELFYLRPTRRNLAVIGAREVLAAITHGAGAVLEAGGLKDRVKRFLRRRAIAGA